ncbi:MAG: MFS transporter [Anaerolineae bacterium]
MQAKTYQVYGYRWVVLAVVMFINLTIQMLWITYAPITGPAAKFYGVSDLMIGLLAMTFMIAFIPLSIPVAWVIDTYGHKRAVGIGVVLMSLFGLLRGTVGADYTLVLLCTIGIAVAQPFLLNAWTKTAAAWFATEERATAVGLTTAASLIGTAIGMVLTPLLTASWSIPAVQLAYGGLAALSAVLFLVFARENPPTPPCPPGEEARALMLDGLKHAFTVKPFLIYLAIFFIGMGVFNGLSTWIEDIVRPRGFSPTDAGVLGAVFLISGILGAFVVPLISDRQHKRQRFLVIGILGALPGLLGVTFATDWNLLLLSAFVLGFFLVSTGPIGMQYAAKITYPTPEGASNGLIQLFGQASVVFVYLMEVLAGPDGSFTSALLLSLGLLMVSLILMTQLRDAPRLPPVAVPEPEVSASPS